MTLFYEPSTRTRSSFEVAAERLSADVTNFTVSTSSVVKGESVQDTIATLQAMKVDYVIVRHYNSGLPNVIARHTCASVINAGDGAHAHPSQALLDSFTIREVFPEVRGKRVLIVGDILHSRVARSTSLLMKRLGMEVAVPGAGLPGAAHGALRHPALFRFQRGVRLEAGRDLPAARAEGAAGRPLLPQRPGIQQDLRRHGRTPEAHFR